MNDKKRVAALIGATGLIGSQLLHLLLQDEGFTEIRMVTRRTVPVKHQKLVIKVVSFNDEQALRRALSGSDVLFCAVGTTQQKVKGNEVEYRKVDYDIPVNAARLCAAEGVPRMLLVSSVGANSRSRNFYLRLKGEVEDALFSLGKPVVQIFRPSMLLGDRNEFRLGEKIAQPLMKAVKFLIPMKYKPIPAYDVASAMIAASKLPVTDNHIYHYRDMIRLSKSL